MKIGIDKKIEKTKNKNGDSRDWDSNPDPLSHWHNTLPIKLLRPIKVANKVYTILFITLIPTKTLKLFVFDA